jgi:hypothetical protein
MIKLSALLISLTLTASTPKSPELYVRFDKTYNYEAINPLLCSTELAIDCGHEFEVLKVVITPRTREFLAIRDSSGRLDTVVCHLDSWKKLK